MDTDKMAEGFIREAIGSDIKSYEGGSQSEKHGKVFTFQTHILTEEKLSVLKERFEILSVVPVSGERYFNVNLRRRK